MQRNVGSRYLYFKTTGGRCALHFAAEPPTHLETGARVRVTGVRAAQTLALSSNHTRRPRPWLPHGAASPLGAVPPLGWRRLGRHVAPATAPATFSSVDFCTFPLIT